MSEKKINPNNTPSDNFGKGFGARWMSDMLTTGDRIWYATGGIFLLGVPFLLWNPSSKRVDHYITPQMRCDRIQEELLNDVLLVNLTDKYQSPKEFLSDMKIKGGYYGILKTTDIEGFVNNTSTSMWTPYSTTYYYSQSELDKDVLTLWVYLFFSDRKSGKFVIDYREVFYPKNENNISLDSRRDSQVAKIIRETLNTSPTNTGTEGLKEGHDRTSDD